MENLGFLLVLIPLVGIGVIVVFIVAVIQENKGERKTGFRQAFFTVVTLAMLIISVGTAISLLGVGLKQLVFRQADSYQQRYNAPPSLYVQNGETREAAKPAPVNFIGYQCDKTCEFTEADKTALTNWKEQYRNWQREHNDNLPLRRQLASTLAFLIVALPLYLVFRRPMESGAKREHNERQKTSPVRSLYYYSVAFGGLIIAVIGLGMMINTGLNAWLKTQPASVTEPIVADASSESGIQSIIACRAKCDFSEEDVALANQWQASYSEWKARRNKTAGQYQNDLTNAIPLFLVGSPLFWYHFSRIRKETQETPKPETPDLTS